MQKLDPKLKYRMERFAAQSHPVQITCNDDCTPMIEYLDKIGVRVDDNMSEIQLLFADLTSRQIENLLQQDSVARIALDDDASVVQ